MKITDLKYNRRNVTTHGVLGLEKICGLLIRKNEIKFLIYRVMAIVLTTNRLDKAIEEVEKYLSLKNMNTFDAFKNGWKRMLSLKNDV